MFLSFPYFLTLQLKRFDFDYTTMHRIKLNDMVTFPEILNLNQFVWDDAPGDSKDEAGENRDPASMSDDSGGGASGGGTTGLTTGNSHRGGTVNGHCSTEHGSTASGPTTQIAVDHLEDGMDESTDIGCTEDTEASAASHNNEAATNYKNEKQSKSQYEYELFSIMIHSGSAVGGHYYAYIKSFSDGQWYSFNDQHVTRLIEKHLEYNTTVFIVLIDLEKAFEIAPRETLWKVMDMYDVPSDLKLCLLSSGKAPGSDSIPAEVYKEGGSAFTEKLHQMFLLVAVGDDPQEFKDASIVHLYKRKGNHQVCDNHRGTPTRESGFWKERGTTDMMFAARQLQEKCQEQNSNLFSTYVDLTKAFDTVSREGLWKIMAKYGCPRKFISTVQQFHTDMQAQVQDNGETSEPFPVTNGVKQGCVLAPTLFSLVFSAMLTDAFRDGDVGIDLTDTGTVQMASCSTSGGFKQKPRSRQTSSGTSCLLMTALNAGSEADMQRNVDKFSISCTNFGLTISIKKTEVLHQPAPGKTYGEPNITVNGQRLNALNRFTYLGSTLSQNATIDDEVNVRIARASVTFGRLHANVWNRRGISIQTKLKVYRAIVLPTLLYACETWTVYQRHAKKLNHFHTTCLRKLLNIKWQDRIPDTEVLAQADLPSIYTTLMQSQLRWAGHVARMPDHRLPKKLFYGELQQGKRSHGVQKKRFKDTLKTSLKAFAINPDSWEQTVMDRAMWHSSVHKGSKICEANRTAAAEQRRQARKARASNPQDDVPLIPCPNCQCTFCARIGLVSHLRTHQIQPRLPPDD
ncbi:hypothetical protein LSAT2_024917 [Lamellibrachia satsuma]|nr:hypothetical protein LSAT2_024917 [Lamellibrachia satsuma]